MSESRRYSQTVKALKMPLPGNSSSKRKDQVFSRFSRAIKLKLKVRGNASLKVTRMVLLVVFR